MQESPVTTSASAGVFSRTGGPRVWRRAAAATPAALLGAASTWDVAGALGWLPGWWPPVSYAAVAAGIGLASLATLVRVLGRRRDAGFDSRTTAVELLSVGLFLGVWLLRGHAEIPPDPPLVAGQIAAFTLLIVAAWRRKRAAR